MNTLLLLTFFSSLASAQWWPDDPNPQPSVPHAQPTPSTPTWHAPSVARGLTCKGGVATLDFVNSHYSAQLSNCEPIQQMIRDTKVKEGFRIAYGKHIDGLSGSPRIEYHTNQWGAVYTSCIQDLLTRETVTFIDYGVEFLDQEQRIEHESCRYVFGM